MTLTFGSLFSGIGGMDLGLERAGLRCEWQVEIDDYATRVLERHWPNVRRWRDIRTFPPDAYCDSEPDGAEYAEERFWHPGVARWRVDLICGGFPCQDISYAGKGAGLAGERSGLFYEAIRVVRLLRPRYVLLENVAALLTRGLDQVLGTLASVGYRCESHCLPAAAFGAPHIRDRVFLLGWDANGRNDCSVGEGHQQNAFASRIGTWDNQGIAAVMPNPHSPRLPQRKGQDPGGTRPICWTKPTRDSWWDAEPDVGRGFDGFSMWLDGGGLDGDAAKKYARQAVRELRGFIQPETIQRCAGELHGVSETQVLLALLCEYAERKEQGRLEMERQEAGECMLRSVWRHIESACSPLRSRHYEQPAKQFADALRKLSCNTPSQYPAVWKSGQWEDGISRVATGVPSRVDRLRGLGNAVVPQVAEWIGRRIVEFDAGGRSDGRRLD